MDRKNLTTRVLTSETVIITVGQPDTQKTFFIHKKLFEKRAPVFYKMFDSNFKKGITGLATLPDDSSEVFEIFAQWLYSPLSDSFYEGNVHIFSSHSTSRAKLVLLKTIEFADKYFIHDLSDLAISSWIIYQRSNLPPSELKAIINYIVANISHLSKARAYFARPWAWETLQHQEEGFYKRDTPDLNAFIDDEEFMALLMREMSCLARETNFGGMFRELPLCVYHHHDKDIRCMATYTLEDVRQEAVRNYEKEKIEKKRKRT